MPQLKRDSSPEIVEALRQLEAQADECWRPLKIVAGPSNVAAWALLTGGISLVEREQSIRGSNTPHFDAMLTNVSRFVPIGLTWVFEDGQTPSTPLDRRWSTELGATVNEAISVAQPYSSFEVCFQAFHKNLYAAEVITPTLVRFTAQGSERDRQVSAHRKGLRPREGAFAVQRPVPQPQTPRVQELFESTLRRCRRTGRLRFECDDTWDLWRELLPEYQERLLALSRRAADLSLGDYTLRDFTEFYAALITVCAVHDFLCFGWGRAYGIYPLESAAIVRSRANWVATLSALSNVAREKCHVILADLTFTVRRSVDLRIQPFVLLDGASDTLALAPPFPLHSRHDENILRVCSQTRRQVFDLTSLGKESEMLTPLCTAAAQYCPQGAVPLPAAVPDIDFIATDEASSTVVLAELKWIRQTVRPAEIPDRDAEVLKGIDQLTRIQRFLADAPDYLARHGKLPRLVSQYEHAHYLLIARDHWLWVAPRDGIAIIEFDAFMRALTRSSNLHAAIEDLLRYEWLPVEGRDFFVRFERATVNGVSIESEVFYSTAPGLA